MSKFSSRSQLLSAALLLGVVITGFAVYDFSLHLAELLEMQASHPLWPFFESRQAYTRFWTVYWGGALVLSMSLSAVLLRLRRLIT